MKQIPQGFHHADQQFLLADRAVDPDERLQQGAGKAAAQVPHLPQAGVAIEDGVDGLQRPTLVEDNAILEQALAKKHDACVVQIVEQEFGFADEPFLGADAAEILLG